MNLTDLLENDTLVSSMELTNPCPRQRNITRPLLFVHNCILFFFGSIFNFLAFAILMQRALRCQSTFAYLAFLSLSNGLLSLVHFSKWMFKFYFNFLFEHFLITCRLHRFLSDFLTHFSLFTLICVNVDRARTVTQTRPTTKYSNSKFRLVFIKECLVATALCAFHFHWLIKYGYHDWYEDTEMTVCGLDDNQTRSLYNYFLTTVYPPFELIVFFCLPLLINIFCTIIIVRSLSIRMRTAKQFQSKTRSSNELPPKKESRGVLSCFIPKTTGYFKMSSCLGFQIQCRRHTQMRLKLTRNKQSLIKYDQENQILEREKSSSITPSTPFDNQTQLINKKSTGISEKKHRTRRTRDIHLSAMLISLNILYLLLNLPFNLHQTFVKRFHNKNSDPCEIMFISLLLDALQQTFFSTNFFLYVLTNRRFREEFYNTVTEISSHCKRKSTKQINQKPNTNRQSRTSSFNPSTAILHSVQNGEQQMMSIPVHSNRDSVTSDLESFIATIPTTQQTNLMINESKLSAKLVAFKGIDTLRGKQL